MKILLMGNPNVGKSVLFSRLTGARVIASNYPGTTVSFTRGYVRLKDDERAEVIDVPGTYTLTPTCKAEEVAVQMLEEADPGDVVINVVDATKLERNLNLTFQLLEKNIPTRFDAHQNYPNPFNLSTIIKYSLPEDSRIKITIYNIQGQKIKQLINDHQSAGHKSIVWDGKNQNDRAVASGVYFYRIQTDDFVSTKKMLLLK